MVATNAFSWLRRGIKSKLFS